MRKQLDDFLSSVFLPEAAQIRPFSAGLPVLLLSVRRPQQPHHALCLCVLSETEDHRYKIMMYMNYKDFQNYQNCEIPTMATLNITMP